MYNKIKNFLRGDEPKEPKKHHTPKKDLPDDQVDISRRRILKGLGAIGIAACAGINTAACAKDYHYRENFFQNFDYRDYSPFRPDECKEWQTPEGYVDDNIGLALQNLVNEEFTLKIPLNKIIGFYYDNGKITYQPVTENPQEIKQLLSDAGIKTKNVSVENTQYEFNITITGTENPPATLKLHILKGLAIFLKNTTSGGKTSEINLNFKENSRGVDAYSGIEKRIGNQDVQFSYKTKTITPDGMEGTFDATAENLYNSSDPAGPAQITRVNSPESLINFMKNCTSLHTAMHFFYCHFDGHEYQDIFPEISYPKPDFSNITMAQLLEIFRLMPRNPQAFAGFMRFVIGYSKSDQSGDDEFRHPIETLRSKWGDCDDYTSLSYFWAYLKGYTPNLVGIKSSDKRHVFIRYQDENKETVIIDNSRSLHLGAGETVDNYINAQYPNYQKEFDEHL